MKSFNCGCKFEEDKDGRLIMPLDVNKLNLDCQDTWDLISSGRTIGCFQIDSGLGRTMSKQLKPQNIDHLAALVAIMRPSALQGVLEDGKSIAHHFIDRKNGVEESICPYNGLENILKNTFYLLIYQEQSIKLGQDIAGMSLADADYYIRKGIGKKKANIIAEGEKIFLEGCKKLGKVSERDSIAIWDWIKSSARYQFNACLSPDTIIELENEQFKILDEIQIGDKIKCPNDDYSNDEFIEVTNKIDQGIQEVYEITLESGKTIKSTLNHKFLCEDHKIRKLSEIIENNYSIMCEYD